MLAFSTVTYAGMFLIGFGLLDVRALAGAALFVVAHGLLKGSMFMCAGVCLHRWGTVNIPALTGRGRAEKLTGVLFVVAGLGLVGVPPFGTFVGKELIEHAAGDHGYGWVVAVIVVASALSTAAVLRAAARIFLGWDEGEPSNPTDAHDVDHAETLEGRTHTPAVMFVPIIVLVAAGLAVGVVPGLEHGAEHAAARFVDATGYAASVIDGAPLVEHEREAEGGGIGAALVASAVTTLLSLAIALALLNRRRLPARLGRGLRAVGQPILNPLRAAHSGHIGDYVAWLTVGVATFGGIVAAVAR